MSTTFYFPSNAAAAGVSPAFLASGSGGWTSFANDDTAGVVPRKKPVTAKTNSANADQVSTQGDSNPSEVVKQQWIYGPIQGVTIAAQTVSVGLMGHHGSTFGFHWLKACAWIAKPDLTVRGVIATTSLLNDNSNSFPANTYSTRFASGTSTSVTALDGDYLVIELGYECQTTTSMSTYFQLGDGNAADITTSGSSTVANPVFNFPSTTFALLVGPTTLSYAPNPWNGVVNFQAPSIVPTTDGLGSLTYSVTAGSLPTGMSLNSSTGIISGTPTVGGTYTATIQVSNSQGSASTSVTIRVGRLGTKNISITMQ